MHKGSTPSHMRGRRHRAEIRVSKQHFLTFLFGLFFPLTSSSEKTRHHCIFHHLPLRSAYLNCPQCPVSKEHPGSVVQHGHLASLEPEAREALGQRRGVEDLVNTQAPPAGLQLRLSRRPQHHQSRLPASHQSCQLALLPLPARTPSLLCPWGKLRHGDTSDTWDVLHPGAWALHTGMRVTRAERFG